MNLFDLTRTIHMIFAKLYVFYECRSGVRCRSFLQIHMN